MMDVMGTDMRKIENHQGKVRTRVPNKQHSASNINLEYLQDMAEGDQHFVIEVIELFIADAPGVLQQALVYHKSGNYPLLKVSVHKLKSSIKMLGDEALAILAQDIENLAVNDKSHDVIAPQLHQFTRGVNKLLEGLATELKHLRGAEQAV